MLTDNTWLLKIAASANPQVMLPSNADLSPNLAEAWRQVCSLLRINSMALAKLVSASTDIALADISQFDPDVASVLEESVCRQHQVVPICQAEGELVVGISNPYEIPAVEPALKFSKALHYRFVILPPDDVDTYLTYLFGQFSQTSAATSVQTIDLDRADDGSHENAATVKLARAILRDAIKKQASDIHIQPFAGGGVIRFRIDGRMQRVGTVPVTTLDRLARYFIAQCKGDTSRLMQPQDGRVRLLRKAGDFDLRMSFLPSHGGVRIVARLLSQSQKKTLSSSNFSRIDLQALRRMASNTSGMILLTGPTGSGKSTTLFGLLSELNKVDVTVITLENPVEYILPGTSQVNIDEARGLSFAGSLRAVLRQDPDIILVGEIRDSETARTAAQAAMTGHLVFSTLHTNDVFSTLPRLASLEVEPTVMADSLVGVVSQRLLRRVCTNCALATGEPYSAAEKQYYSITGEHCAKRTLGCEKCNFSGYSGRLPVLEWLEVSPSIRANLMEGRFDIETIKASVQHGYRSMAASVSDALVSGLTSIDEVHRSMGLSFWHQLAQLHDFSPEDLRFTFSNIESSEPSYSLLMITADKDLCTAVEQTAGIPVLMSDSITEANKILETNMGIVAIAADSRLMDDEVTNWLKNMREALAWAGLSVTFISDSQTLTETVTEYGADVVEGFPVDVDNFARLILNKIH